MSTGGMFSMGPHTYPVSMTDVFGANRTKLGRALVAARNGVVFLEGGTSRTRYDSDHEPLFRQESYFWWLCGVKEPDCSLSIRYCVDCAATDGSDSTLGSCTTTLFVPRLDADYATVMGKIRTLDEWKEIYVVDVVKYTDEIEPSLLRDLRHKAATEQPPNGNEALSNGHGDANPSSQLLLLRGLNSDSAVMYEPPSFDHNAELTQHVDTSILFPILAECRVHKSIAEQRLLQHVTEITSFAHAYVMRNFGWQYRRGTQTTHDDDTVPWEYQAESLFQHYCYFNYGARYMGYTPICGCGPDAAILHYGHAGEPNARPSRRTDMCLFDMGAEYSGYGSDVTCSFPVSGAFTTAQGVIYQAVLEAQVAVYDRMKPGVSWVDCHTTAERAILTALCRAGLVVVPSDRTLDDLVSLRLGAVFMPHGLGHLIGCDTHDVGGYLPGHAERSTLPGLKKLRTARILEADMVLTVEPGCYFIDHLLDAALHVDSPLAPFLNATAINNYRGFGGVRLEDVVQVTETGIINYTVCPRTIPEVESVLAGAKWPPVHDSAPELRRVRLTATTPLPSPPSL